MLIQWKTIDQWKHSENTQNMRKDYHRHNEETLRVWSVSLFFHKVHKFVKLVDLEMKIARGG